jgi:Tol biopolymer transport system component
VWRILFKGAPCSEMLNPGCQPFDGTPSYLYTIDSDGTDLKKIEVVPEGSYFVRLSPDGTRLAYIGPDNGLYLTDLDGTNSTKVLDRLVSFEFTPDGEYIYYSIHQVVNDTPGYFETQAVIGRICLDGSENFILTTLPTLRGAYIRVSPDGEWILAWGESKETITKHLLYLVTTGDGTVHHLYDGNHIGSARWSMDETAVQFIEWDREAGSCVNVFNTIDLDGHRLSTSTVTGLDSCLARGDWSPDGQEFAFAVSPGPENSQHGLWILSLNSGYWYKILSDYSVSSVRTWSGFPAD